MKYTITRAFSFNNEKFQVISDAKTIYKVKTTPSKECKGQFNVKLSSPVDGQAEDDYCLVEPDPEQQHNYLIYSKNDQAGTKSLFGQLRVQAKGFNNYLYTIIIGQKLYKVRSCDLKDRRLTIFDAIQMASSSQTSQQAVTNYPELLYQVIDSFSKSNQKYHVTIHDKEWSLGYLAITVLLDLHECKRSLD